MKYYNYDKYNQILKLFDEQKMKMAIESLKDYLEVYPYDLRAVTLYASLLINNGEIEQAKELLDNAIITPKTRKTNKIDLIIIKLKLLCCDDKFQEAYDYLKENELLIMNNLDEYHTVLIFLKTKLGLPVEYDKNSHLPQQYTINQMVSYSEEEALEHIRKHIGDYASGEKSCFDSEFPLEEVFYKIREMIPINNYSKLFSGIGKNLYIFKCEGNGRNCRKVADYIRIITIQGTNNIITMYPYDNKCDLPTIPFELKEEIEEKQSKLKKLSQIEKFNLRYSSNSN